MRKRGYKVCEEKLWKHQFWDETTHTEIDTNSLYLGWHNDRYLKQCLYNLQEKYDCGGISEEEWEKIAKKFQEHLLS
jgi:hypothetical protein